MKDIRKHPMVIWLKYGPDDKIKQFIRTMIMVYIKFIFRTIPSLLKHLNKLDNWSKR